MRGTFAMKTMASYERVHNALARQPVDEIPFMLDLWDETQQRYRQEGHLAEGTDLVDHFGQDLRVGGWLDSTADLDFGAVTLEETEETILQLDGNGAKLRRPKHHAGTPEHVDFTVRDRASWLEHARPFLLEIDRRRIPLDDYRKQRRLAAEQQKFFTWHGVAPFEQMHPVCGHEHMLMGMALDPGWIQDMVDVYVNLTINHLEVLFAEEGRPDGLFFYEDMGFKSKPFMSPTMYEQLIMPGHKRLFDFAHSQGCKVIVHSCGYVEPLIPGLIKGGMDCLQAMEVKAGMDLPRLFQRFGSQIAFFGGIDVRTLISNDPEQIDSELAKKITPVIAGGGGYILHTDHSEPPQIDYDTIWYFIKKGKDVAGKAMK
jgi:uroporphyrinogen decarboxylase